MSRKTIAFWATQRAEPSSVQEKRPNPEVELLGQYVARRDAQLRKGKTETTCSGDIQKRTEIKGKEVPNITRVDAPCDDAERLALLEQLQAVKKEREVLCAEKLIAETKHSTLVKTLETERKDLSLMRNKLTTLETEKRELKEALIDAEKKEREMQEAIHERVWGSLLINVKKEINSVS